jgi:hypothetical protein
MTQNFPQWQSQLIEIWDSLQDAAMPYRFNQVIVHFSESPILNQAIKEWRLLSVNGLRMTQTACICSHLITLAYYVRNIFNGNILQIGGDCLIKFESSITSNTRSSVPPSEAYRSCNNCHKYLIACHEPLWKKLCISCWLKYQLLRKLKQRPIDLRRFCVSCNAILGDDKPEYYIRCYQCWQQRRLSILHQTASLIQESIQSGDCLLRTDLSPNIIEPTNQTVRSERIYTTS